MPSPNDSRTTRPDGGFLDDKHEHHTHRVNPSAERRTPEQLGRLAQLVATGELPLPVDLPSDQREHVVQLVSKSRRRRLVRFIARAIAWDIQRSRET